VSGVNGARRANDSRLFGHAQRSRHDSRWHVHARLWGEIGILTSAVDPRIKVLDASIPGRLAGVDEHFAFVPEERDGIHQTEFLKKAAALDPRRLAAKDPSEEIRLQDAIFEANTPKRPKKIAGSPACRRNAGDLSNPG